MVILKKKLSRRSLLRSAGIAAAASPLLPLLNASGDAGETPCRLVLFFTPHGTVRNDWLPTGSETSFNLSRILSPLEPHKDKIIVLDGLRMRADDIFAAHTQGPPYLWTASPLSEEAVFRREEPGGAVYDFGWNTHPSVDQVIADRVSEGFAYRSIDLGVRAGGPHPGHRMIYSGAGAPVTPKKNPVEAFDDLFFAGAPVTEVERLRSERRSVLDSVGRRLETLSPRVAPEDRLKIDSHLTAVREIETALDAAGTCEMQTLLGPTEETPDQLDRQIEILTAALECGLTRNGSIQYSVGENDQNVYDWLGISNEHHLTTHENTPAANDQISDIYTWYAEKFAYLLQRLDSIPEGDGTMLDHTVVCWGSEIGRGWDHSQNNIPFVLAGGSRAGLRLGRFVQHPGVDHNRLLVSLCHLMGQTDINTFGLTDVGSGPLPGLI